MQHGLVDGVRRLVREDAGRETRDDFVYLHMQCDVSILLACTIKLWQLLDEKNLHYVRDKLSTHSG